MWAERQLHRLVLHTAERIPFYRDLWRAAGVEPRDVLGAADLPRLPMVDKPMIIDAGPRGYDTSIHWSDDRIITTSGTSGRAIQVRRTRPEERASRRSILRMLMFAGARPGQRQILFASSWLKNRKGRVLQWLAPTRWFDASAPHDDVIRALEEFKPHGLIGQTGGMYLLAREIVRRGLRFPLRLVMPTGTTLVAEMRQALVDAFGVQPCDLYGAIEVGNIAWQCPRGNYHIDADRIMVEIVDADGRPVPRGEYGQVVVTSLWSYSQPFIRYRLHDIAALSTRACGCGCRFPLLEPVQGRVNDFLPTPSGELVSPHFFFHIFDRAGGVPVKEWRVIQDDLHHLTYEYIPEERFEPAQLQFGLDLIQQRFGTGCNVRSVRVESVPMSPTGKRTCIVSRLRPQAASRYVPWTGDAVGAAAAVRMQADQFEQITGRVLAAAGGELPR